MIQEILVLTYLLKDEEGLKEKMKEEYFEHKEAQRVFKEIVSLSSPANKEVTTRDLSFVLGEDYSKILSRMRKIRREGPLPIELIKKFIANRLIKAVFLEELPRGLSIDYDKIEETILEIKETLSTKDRKQEETFETFRKSFILKENSFEGESPSFLNNINLLPGELGVILAPPKGGKTTSLVNIGFLNLIHGKRVFHWSLEIPKDQLLERYCLRALKKEVISEEEIIKTKKKIKLCGGELLVRDEAFCHLYQIEKAIRETSPEVLILDYADLIISPKRQSERRFEIREIYTSLRNFAKRYKIPIWTASQTTAKASGKKFIGLEDIEEAKVVKAGTCNLMLAITQNPEEAECNMAHAIIVASSRGKVGKKRRAIEFSPNLQFLGERFEERSQ